jgi:hypothetical protein
LRQQRHPGNERGGRRKVEIDLGKKQKREIQNECLNQDWSETTQIYLEWRTRNPASKNGERQARNERSDGIFPAGKVLF